MKYNQILLQKINYKFNKKLTKMNHIKMNNEQINNNLN